MINDLSELLKKEVGPELGSKFNFSPEKSFSIIDTIAETVKGKKDSADLGTLASGLSTMVSKGDNLDSEIVNKLMKKEGLSETMAAKIKDFVLPIALDYLKSKMGSSGLGGLLGKQGISNFKF